MAGSDSRKASGTPRPAKVTEKEIPATANEAAVEPLRLGDTVVFDPANSFFPQTLLKPDDLRALALKPRPAPKQSRLAKVLVGVVLAIGAGLAYVFFLSGPASVPGAKDTAAAPTKDSKSSPSATGSITTPAASAVVAPAASIPPPAIVAAPKTAPAAAQPQPPAPQPPVAAVVRVPSPAPQTAVVPTRPYAPPVSYTGSSGVASRSTVTHTKGATEAAGSGKAGEPAAAAAAAATVAVPAAPSQNARSGPCSEALAALGLCSPASK